MKKTKLLAFGLCAIMLLAAPLVSCANGSLGDNNSGDNSTSNSSDTGGNGSGDNGTTPGGSSSAPAASLQSQLDNAAAGSVVTLDSTLSGTSLTVSKALTIDGNNIEGLTVTISPAVTANVKLKNFKKATVKVAAATSSASSSVNSTRSRGGEAAGSNEEEAKLKKLGEDALPLFFENCEIEEFEAAADVALHLENGSDKTEIEKLSLREGLENFTFFEFDEADTDIKEKSRIEKLYIEDGIEEINLIGGTFDDVDFADDFSGKVEFNYDKEFVDDQLNFDEAAFFADSKVEEKDVAVADNTVDNGSGIYRLTITKDEFEYLNGRINVLFMTDDQARDIQNIHMSQFGVFTPEHPVYCMGIAGDFTVPEADEEGFYTVCGSEGVVNKPYYVNGELAFFKEEAYEYYPTLEKNAVVAELLKGTSGTSIEYITYYINMNEIKKTDLLIGAEFESTPIGEPGDKISKVDLTGYKPYIAINFPALCRDFSGTIEYLDEQSQNAYEWFADGLKNDETNEWIEEPHITTEALAYENMIARDNRPIELPIHSSIQFLFPPRYIMFEMPEYDTYPDVDNLEYSQVEVKDKEYWDVYYFDKDLKMSATPVKVITQNICPKADDYEYYLDDKLTHYAFDYTEEKDPIKALYARPYRKIDVMFVDKDGSLEWKGDRLGYVETNFFDIYKSYDASTGKTDNKVTIHELAASLKEGDTVYLVWNQDF